MSDTRFGGLAADSYGTDTDRAPLVLLHGLTFDRRQWGPVLAELAATDPDRRILALDLPGHGASPRRGSYAMVEVAATVHEAVTEAGLDAPVVVGHSVGGLLATIYAANHPVRGVVNVDQPLQVAGFQQMLRQFEPRLRGPRYGEVWATLVGSMHVELLPPAAQDLVRTATTPRQDLFLGYWDEVFTVPAAELAAWVAATTVAIRDARVPYHFISGSEVDPAYRAWLSAALPDAVVTVLPGSGHFPHLAHPAAVAGLLTTVGRDVRGHG